MSDNVSRRPTSVASDGKTSTGDLTPVTRPKRFFFQRIRHSALAAMRERFGGGLKTTTATGTTNNVLDQSRMLSMQEDARCRKISSEVMKHCLYKPVAPCRRRALSRSVSAADKPTRGAKSMPATRGPSHATTPMLSPTTSYSFFDAFFSPRATSPVTPECEEEEEYHLPAFDEPQGLEALFRPRPRYVHASCHELDCSTSDGIKSPESDGSVFLLVPNISHRLRNRGPLTGSVTAV